MYVNFIFKKEAQNSDFFFYLRGRGRPVYNWGQYMSIKKNVSQIKNPLEEDINYAKITYPDLIVEHYNYNLSMLPHNKLDKIDQLLIKLQKNVPAGYHKLETRTTIDNGNGMTQLFFGTRLFFKVEITKKTKKKDENKHLVDFPLKKELVFKEFLLIPNSGKKTRNLMEIEEYAGFTLKELVNGLEELGFKCDYDEVYTRRELSAIR